MIGSFHRIRFVRFKNAEPTYVKVVPLPVGCRWRLRFKYFNLPGKVKHRNVNLICMFSLWFKWEDVREDSLYGRGLEMDLPKNGRPRQCRAGMFRKSFHYKFSSDELNQRKHNIWKTKITFSFRAAVYLFCFFRPYLPCGELLLTNATFAQKAEKLALSEERFLLFLAERIHTRARSTAGVRFHF